MYLWRDSHIERDSDQELKHVYGGIHKGSSNISMEEFIGGVSFI